MTREKARRILLLTYSLGGGGAERTLLNLAQRFDREDVLVVSFSDRVEYDLGDLSIEILGVDPLSSSRDAAARARRMVEVLRRFASVRAHFAPDVCVSFGFWPNLINAMTRGDGRSVLSVRNNLSTLLGSDRFAPLYRAMVQCVFPGADHIVSLSRGVRQDLLASFHMPPELVTPIYNPVEIGRLEALASEPFPQRELLGERWVVTVGRMVEQKGQWRLLRAFARTRESVPDARLVILGEGALRERLEALAGDLGFRVSRRLDEVADVYMPGFVSNPYTFMRHASVFAFPSLWEGLGNSLVEAMACGASVCVSDCKHGPRELVAPGVSLEEDVTLPLVTPLGTLMPTPDRAWADAREELSSVELAWARRLTEMLLDPTRGDANRDAARASMLGRFDVSEIVAQWRSVFVSVNSGAPMAPHRKGS